MHVFSVKIPVEQAWTLLLFIIILLVSNSSGQQYGYHQQPFQIPMSYSPGYHPFHTQTMPRFRQPHRIDNYNHHGSYSHAMPSFIRPNHLSQISLPKVKQTLGAIGTLARHLIKKSRPLLIDMNSVSSSTSSNSREEVQVVAESQNYNKISSSNSQLASSPTNTSGDNEEELKSALYILGRAVLGQNVTDSLVPVVRTVNEMGKFLPPLVYRDGRIILGGGSGNISRDGEVKDVVCTTPNGQQGKCQDISGCPSLLLDLQKLRKSLCFQRLFVPGVCCPDRSDYNNYITTTTTQRPERLSTTTRTTTTTRKPTNLPSGIAGLLGLLSGGGNNKLPGVDECGKAEIPSFRIVGGDKATPGVYPWMGSIFLSGPRGKEYWCGCTLISKRYVLTAAHCTKVQKQKPFSHRQFTIRLGDYDIAQTDDPSSPEEFQVVKVHAHPDFNGVGFYNDIAVLELDRDVNYNRYISPICLPTGRSLHNTFQGTFPTVIGWGTNQYGGREHTALQQVKLPVWSNSDCDKAYFQPITEIFLCAGYPQGGKDACQGDSGGPLMLEVDNRWTQIGIVSFGNKCAQPNYPGVYTRVTQFMDFIKKSVSS